LLGQQLLTEEVYFAFECYHY